jgi:hypothetical protein
MNDALTSERKWGYRVEGHYLNDSFGYHHKIYQLLTDSYCTKSSMNFARAAQRINSIQNFLTRQTVPRVPVPAVVAGQSGLVAMASTTDTKNYKFNHSMQVQIFYSYSIRM